MENNKFKIGDVVKYKDDNNNRYKITAIKEDGTLRTESIISGNVYFFQPGQIEPAENDLRRPEIVDCNGFTLDVGDPVRIYGDSSGDIYRVTGTKFIGFVSLMSKRGHDSGFYNASAVELVTDEYVPKVGDIVSRKGLPLFNFTVTEILDNGDVRTRGDDGATVTFNKRDLILVGIPVGEKPSKIPGSGKDGSGKDDRADGKPRWELLPLDAIEEIVRVYTMGAEKYADDAWKTIPDAHRRYLAALFRHIAAYERGERKDKESGLSHLAHAAWNAIAILWLDMHGDDKSQG